ncbi:hypothetical protein KNP414_07204 [Paenibacillus mucilaginosus KNP414]|uniref:Uncharacterized protein n=1 Tax=Paenibacillus mucilaginosus (strain KNP414) TaxID=1036673 RepID=F8FN44_PAEMK|nr:hypothetical protein KNP414_07204 [Paenibacillus mucilaginosus KNP414]
MTGIMSFVTIDQNVKNFTFFSKAFLSCFDKHFGTHLL